MPQDMTLDSLERLPAAQMLALDILLSFHHPNSEDEKTYSKEKLMVCRAVIGRMSNLRELSLTVDVVSMIALGIMFSQLHQLEKLSLRLINNLGVAVNGDDMMSLLVQQNPNLRDVRISGIHFSSSAYESLAFGWLASINEKGVCFAQLGSSGLHEACFC